MFHQRNTAQTIERTGDEERFGSDRRADVGADRGQATLFPPCLENRGADGNPVRVIDVFVGALGLGSLGSVGGAAAATGRPGYHPSALLELYVHGCLNRIPSCRRLEREADRNVEIMWLTARLSPDRKTIA